MLTLTRTIGASPAQRITDIVVPPGWSGTISVHLIDVDRNKVRLGIEAPQEVRIFRRELLDQAGKPSEEGNPS